LTQENHAMRRIRILLATGTAVVVLAATTAFVTATPGSGVSSTVFAIGQFDVIDATSLTDIEPGSQTDYWQARIKTKGSTSIHIIENRIAPGGTFGWHSHPGPSLVVVKAGALTLYLASDPSCTGRVVPAGMGFVDNGGDVHVVRNEGTVEAVAYVTSLVPEGFARRTDELAPSQCAF
jgi:quercetin dioxygenase-like cupin family protein